VSGELSALRVLIVEDEYYLADDLAAVLRGHGAEVVGPAATLEQAHAMAREQIDCAILDMNLRGNMAFPVADQLEAAGIPFLIASGYNSAALPERFSAVPRIEKPFNAAEIAAAIPHILTRR
jgi:DNA-binding response OmpR family regulator